MVFSFNSAITSSKYIVSCNPSSRSVSSSLSRNPSVKNGPKAEWVQDDDSRSRKLVNDVVVAVLGQGDNAISIPKVLTNIVVDYLEESYRCFGEAEWNNLGVRVPPAPPLPADFSRIWNGPCPIWPDKKVKDTHMLVYIPARLTLKSLEEIAKLYFPDNSPGFRLIWDGCKKELRDRPIDKACWVLMTMDVLPNSRDKTYTAQAAMVSALAAKALASYEVPQTLEASVCILTHYCCSQKPIFSCSRITYTLCQENIRGEQIVVGGFYLKYGLVVGVHNTYSGTVGVAALRKFF